MAILWKLEYYIDILGHQLGLPIDRSLPQRRRDGAQRQERFARHQVFWDRGERFVIVALGELF